MTEGLISRDNVLKVNNDVGAFLPKGYRDAVVWERHTTKITKKPRFFYGRDRPFIMRATRQRREASGIQSSRFSDRLGTHTRCERYKKQINEKIIKIQTLLAQLPRTTSPQHISSTLGNYWVMQECQGSNKCRIGYWVWNPEKKNYEATWDHPDVGLLEGELSIVVGYGDTKGYTKGDNYRTGQGKMRSITVGSTVRVTLITYKVIGIDS